MALKPKPVRPVAPWVPIVGAGFGFLTLAGLLAFTWTAGNQPQFICNSFVLLATVFALGAALAAGFIGGSVAFQAQFGVTKGQSVMIGALGGIAVLFGAFFLFHQFKPAACELEKKISEMQLEYNAKLKEQETLQKILLEKNEKLSTDLAKTQTELKSFKEQDILITPQSHSDRLRSLVDTIEVVYKSRKDREEIQALPVAPKSGQLKIVRDLFDDGQPIVLLVRESSEPVRPKDSCPPKISLSRISYVSKPLELQLFLNLDDR